MNHKKIDQYIIRYYTKKLDASPDQSVYDLFQWKTVDVIIKNQQTGAVITDMKNLEFPESYSQNACDIIASKYFRKKGVPNDRGYEYSFKQVVHRLVHFWILSLLDEGLLSPDKKDILYDELAFMLLNQLWAPNSPQFFNTGLKHAYDIHGPAQGHYYYCESSGQVKESDDAFTRTQGSACFIISVKDSLIGDKSLTDQLRTETLLFKYGSGVGTNWSNIRAIDEPLSGGGKSSGLLSFLKVSDKNAGAIKSGGTTRRAAKMNILDLDHPEIMSYISWKASEEDKAKALVKMGYEGGIDGEAYESVSGQNANNSVRIPDAFMESLSEENAFWQLKGRISSTVDQEILSKDLWQLVGQAAWRCGDPGVQFHDNINGWHTCKAGEDGKIKEHYNQINASNPCSEYMFLDDTACNLASINLLKFYNDETHTFDLTGYAHSIMLIQLVLEATIHFGQFPTKSIARRSYLFRTTGLGYANLGNLLMHMALPYDCLEARTIAASLTSLLTGYSYYMSALMAEKVGPFPRYELNKMSMETVLKNHQAAASGKDLPFTALHSIPPKINHALLCQMGFTDIAQLLEEVWQDTLAVGNAFGYRNAQTTVLAPTGTIAFAMDCATTSSEPFFSHIVYKKLVGGNMMEIVNPAIGPALKRLGYQENEIQEITDYILNSQNKGQIEGAPFLIEAHYSVFDTAAQLGSRHIPPDGHIEMVAALSPHISGAISKTVNVAEQTTADEILSIFFKAWQLGVKAITVYRDKCKESQPLTVAQDNETLTALSELPYDQLLAYAQNKADTHKPLRIKPQGIRPAHVHEANINGLKLYITTSFYDDGRLGELYVSCGRQGSLTKGLLDSMSTTISEMLQYGVPPEGIASMYRGQKYEPSGYVTGHPYIKFVDSISDLISKIIDIELNNYDHCQIKPTEYLPLAPSESGKDTIKNYDPRDLIYGELCPNCQSTKMVKNGTCKVCIECGTTTGCN